MKYYPRLVGERIYLSPISLDDIEQYTKWMNDPEITDNLGQSHVTFHREKERKSLEDMMWGHAFAIIEKAEHRLLGNCDFFEVKQLSRRGMCGIFIGEEADRGKGYGAEAMKLLLQYGFDTLNLHNIALTVFGYNERAIACYKKAGFREVGRRREAYFVKGRYHDEVLMDILEDEYRGGL
jgi:RimJ/RimL family protein N-acetyltransferase